VIRALLLAAGLLLATVAEAATVRVGLFVGNDVGLGPDEPLEYAEREARDMARLFQDYGDMVKERVILLQGGSAGDLRQAMLQVEAQIREIEARGDDVMLVVYYSGHASGDGLHMSGSLLPMDGLRRWLESSTARVRVAFVDACESGTLARVRGGAPVETVEIKVDDDLTTNGLAIVSSTGPLSVARESAAFGGGVFSRALMTGLRGSADKDADGQITLDEAYHHAFSETVISTAGEGGRVQRPEYRYEITGVGDVVLTRLPGRAASMMLPEELEGVYTVVSVTTGEVVARIDKKPGEQRRLALPTGRYVVRKVRREDVLLAEVDLAWGGTRWVDDSHMTAVSLGDPLARGEWTLRPLRLALHGLVTSQLYQGNPLTGGGELDFRWLIKPNLAFAAFAGGEFGQRAEFSGLVDVIQARAGVGVMGALHFHHIDLQFGGGVGVAFIEQRVSYLQALDDEEPEPGETFRASMLAPGGWLHAGAHIPVGPVIGLEFGARGHLYRTIVDDEPGSSAVVQGFAGFAARFGGRHVARAGRDAPEP
jgi:hypothetical protein